MDRKIAFLFPGQGSQFVGMGKKLVENYPGARHIFEEADEVLGFALSKICFEGPLEQLTLTRHTQPAIVTHSIAVLHVLMKETGVTPSVVAGHSLGEYAALVAAGALAFRDAVKAVLWRGTWMQEAVPAGHGGMLALVGVEEPDAHAYCKEVNQKSGLQGAVSVANLNGGGQVVVAGHQTLCQWAMAHGEMLTVKPKKVIALNVSAPFHCPMMKPAEDRLSQFLKEFQFAPLKIPYIANVDGEKHSDHEGILGRLVQQVCSPVRWEQSMKTLIKESPHAVWEVGPGKVLSGLLRRIERAMEVVAMGGRYDVEA